MIICLCNGINDKEAVQLDIEDYIEMQKCGVCKDHMIEAIRNKVLDKS